MEERWTADQVLALAPDAASRKAGTKLSAPECWSGTGAAPAGAADRFPEAGGGIVVWGLCRGSGTKPYQTVVATAAPAYTCSCPSRKFPCKHVLGLLLLWSSGPGGGVNGAARQPGWVKQWVKARAERAEPKAARAAAGPADPAAARRRAERRAQRVTAGAAELRQWLADQVRGGLAGADQAGYEMWDQVAARMVDAQAPGLAGRLRELASVPSSGGGWPSRLLADYALLHLLATAYQRIDDLPEPLAATVRSRVGFTIDRAELLSGPTVRDRWLVLGQRDSVDQQRLTVRRAWLRGERCGRMALVLSYGAAGIAPELVLPTGGAFDASLAYFPGAGPLRAVIGDGRGAAGTAGAPPGVTVGEALASYAGELRDDPWLDAWPVVLADVVPVPTEHGWQLADADGDEALPVDRRCLDQPARSRGAAPESLVWRLAAVSGGKAITVFGECGHSGFRPVTVWAADHPDPLDLEGISP